MSFARFPKSSVFLCVGIAVSSLGCRKEQPPPPPPAQQPAPLSPAPSAPAGPVEDKGTPAPYMVDENVGNSSFSAVFDAPFGERINAVSSSVACKISYFAESNSAAGTCSVPLTTIKVDSEETKTEHFAQWATNKKTEPKACKFDAAFKGIALGEPLASEKSVKFTGEVDITICGRKRSDGGRERIEGAAMLFPPGSYGQAETIRIRARIPGFNRDAYQIGPKHTEGWLARVQSLAKVVAEVGDIELSLFAKAVDAGDAAQ